MYPQEEIWSLTQNILYSAHEDLKICQNEQYRTHPGQLQQQHDAFRNISKTIFLQTTIRDEKQKSKCKN